jgi:type VI secretion system protein ImpL
LTIKTLIFALFLYVSLVWVGAAYLRPGRGIQEFGLFWTAMGLVAVLAIIVAARLLGWWRLWRARRATRPAAPPKPAPAVSPDEATLSALLAEANLNLRRMPEYRKRGRTPLSGAPLYLLIGPEGSGKTSTFCNSGLDAHLLAGQVTGVTPVVPTRVCNIWIANGSIFAEISGRIFDGDVGQWSGVLRQLRGRAVRPWWRRMWATPEGFSLRGVIGFTDVKNFTSAADPRRLERLSREWHERLRAIGEVFGGEIPAYKVFTRCQEIQYLPDFFKRITQTEANQILGSTLPLPTAHPSAPPVEAEAKRLTRSFRLLYHALAERRVAHLAHEPDTRRRRAIYEFPREFKRIRSPIVEFLSDAFREDPLRSAPRLRGYYFVGALQAEFTPDPAMSNPEWVPQPAELEATRLFSGDATQIFRPDSPSQTWQIGSRGALRQHWFFVQDLFRRVILADESAWPIPRSEPSLLMYRQAILAGTCIVCGLLSFAFIWSWAGNVQLLREARGVLRAAIEQRPTAGQPANLDAFEGLRAQVARLRAYQRDGAPWSLRWGLYSGDRALTPSRAAYFQMFQQFFLNDLNGAITARLRALPPTFSKDSGDDGYDPAYDALKTHLIVSSGACKADPDLVSRVLTETRVELAQGLVPSQATLENRQIRFYASELPYGNPCRVTQDDLALHKARQYLAGARGIETIYRNLLAQANLNLSKPARLDDIAPSHERVLAGKGEMSPAFTPAGWAFVQKASREGNAGALGEPCVMGEAAGLSGKRTQDQSIERAIQRMYIRDYVAQWSKFLEGFSVSRYASPMDAARKLEILAGHKSPLLALFAMTSSQTSFPSDPTFIERAGKVIPVFNKAEKAADQVSERLAGAGDEDTDNPESIIQAFQPVHWVLPPGSETWVTERNGAYVESLAQLRQSMQDIARGNDPDPAVHQAASQNYEKALDAVRQIARGFRPVGVAGLDGVAQRLLEEPIRNARMFIIHDMEKAAAGKVNGELRAFCGRFQGTVRKFPFRSSGEDVTMEELATWFHPATGAVWKFQAQSLGEFVIKEGQQWKPKDPAGKPQVTQDMLAFLNRAQTITDAFFPAGSMQARFTYTLRPRLDSSLDNATLEIELDGQAHQWTSSLQKQFTWPPPPQAKDLGAVVRLKIGNLTVPVASRGGLWGIFRVVMNDAEPRPASSRLVEWKNLRGGDGRLEPIRPAPVRVEIVEFPGGVDMFNPRFFEGLRCPTSAVQ